MLIMIKTDKLSSEDKWQAESHHITPGSHCNGLRHHLSVHGHWSGGKGGAQVTVCVQCLCILHMYVGIGTIILNVKLKLKLQLNYINSWSEVQRMYYTQTLQTEKYFSHKLYKTQSVVQIKSIMQNIQPWGLRWGWSRVTMRWWVSNYAGHQSSAAAELCSR